jgi:hypothetical protein
MAVRLTDPRADSISECYRCGYDLRGIADEQACPECGLLAERSRRVTDELHNTRPRWLRGLSIGLNAVLWGMVIAVVWPFVCDAMWALRPANFWFLDGYDFGAWGFDLAAVFVLIGIVLLTKKEGYEPADTKDRRQRRWLRAAAVFLVIAVGVQWGNPLLDYTWSGLPRIFVWRGFAYDSSWEMFNFVRLMVLIIALLPMPALLLFRLRGLAVRARSAQLAEHCAIVGVGASAALAFAFVALWFFSGPLAGNRPSMLMSPWGFLSTLIMLTAISLFILWSIYLLIRFAISFRRAARQLRHKWTRDDRAVTGSMEGI